MSPSGPGHGRVSWPPFAPGALRELQGSHGRVDRANSWLMASGRSLAMILGCFVPPRRPGPRSNPRCARPGNIGHELGRPGRRKVPVHAITRSFSVPIDKNGTAWHHCSMSDRPYRTAAEVASELGVSLRTVRRWVADGRLRVTRVGRSVRIPVDAYREAAPPTARTAYGTEGRGPATAGVSEVAAAYSGGRVAASWPDTPERLIEQRRRAAALMDRLAARGRPASGPSGTADAILDAVRDEFGADRLQAR
ncbi:MAG: 17 protein [Chloroflexi bacterium]|nr:17 protein [Chloroflexota bacterium]